MNFSFGPENIMVLMSRDRLKLLEKFWEKYIEGITCKQFIQLMLDSIGTEDDDEKYELVYGCYQLFQEVDINGDGKMEWSEFM